MRINRCLGCMAQTGSYPCPHCGYNGEQNKDHALPCGSILNGRYLIGRVLGQGGFGITYTGWDLSLERKLAIKEYYPGGQVTRTRQTGVSLLWGQTDQAQQLRENGKKTVLHEAQKMAKLESVPEAVHVRDVFQENDTAYIVMDFIEGETLQHKLKREGPMLWKDAEKLFLPLISAMEKVHAAGIIHRDLSPDNFMLQPDGQARILDLGAAKDIQTSSGASSALVVKNGFSPIEQYGTRGGSGTWTDVYAMAATIYYALTGQVPPAATDRLEDDTLNLKSLPTPAHVQAALQRALTVSAKARTQTMGQFLKELQPVEAKKKSEQEKEGPKPEREKKEEPKNEERKTEPVRKKPNSGKKSKTPLLIAAACVAVALIVVLVVALNGNTTPSTATTDAANLSDGLEYKTYSDHISVTGYNGNSTEVVIPAEVDGLPVTTIEFAAFEFCTSLTTITIPDSVTDIESYAFQNCTGLTNITLPSSVTNIETYAFQNCTGLTNITLPGSVTNIETYAFDNCTGLTNITLPSSVTTIGSHAFSGCTALSSITLSDSLTAIGDSAFSSCTSLTSITIPDSVTKIGKYAFSGCTSLTSIIIPDSVMTIWWYAFEGCTALKSASVPAQAEIADNAFPSTTTVTYR